MDDLSAADADVLEDRMLASGVTARKGFNAVRTASATQRDAALHAIAAALSAHTDAILAANAQDVAAAQENGLSAAKVDRLVLNPTRVEAIAEAVRAIAAQDDPVGRELARWDRPSGLDIARVATPIGVIAMIYESRPNVTADAAALCVRAGNAVILRGGSEAAQSNAAIHAAVVEGLQAADLPASVVQRVETTDRAAVGHLLTGLAGAVDLVIPRGGRSLVERVQSEARVPVLGHLEGLCHVYVHEAADLDKARAIAVNAKMRRTGVCGAAETLLIDAAIAETALPLLAADLRAAGCTLRGDEQARAIVPDMTPALEDDWTSEYLDAILAVKVVAGLQDALAHIATYGSGHTESIITQDDAVAEAFLAGVDSAIVMRNASTQFADGGEFGMGAEIGIATGRLHARGPVGAEQLCSFKYIVRGDGQVRP